MLVRVGLATSLFSIAINDPSVAGLFTAAVIVLPSGSSVALGGGLAWQFGYNLDSLLDKFVGGAAALEKDLPMDPPAAT